MTAKEIRDALEKLYPDVTDHEFNVQQSGLAHEHPLIGIGVVLISAVLLETTDPVKLAHFTRYSKRFVRAVASNMQNSGLWTDGKYDTSSWYCGGLLPPQEQRAFWDHVLIGEGSLSQSGADWNRIQDSGMIFWRDKLA